MAVREALQLLFTGDASSLQRAGRDAQAAYQAAKAQAADLAQAISDVNTRIEQAQAKLQTDLTTMEKDWWKNYLTLKRQDLAELEKIQQQTNKNMEREEQRLTQAMTKEAQGRARQIKDALGGALAGGFGIGVGAFAGVAVAQQVGRGVREAVTGWAELGHEVEHTMRLMGTTAANASLLNYAFARFGLTSSDVQRTVAQMTRHIADNEKGFNSLGIATREANGQLLSSYDIFQNTRRVFSESADGASKLAAQLALASRGGASAGASMAELQQILSLTDEQWEALRKEAELNNAILNENEALTGTRMVMATKALDQSLAGLGRTIGQITVGPLTAFIQALTDALTMMTVMANTPTQHARLFAPDMPFLGGLENLLNNAGDIVGGKPTDALKKVNDQLAEIAEARKKIAELQEEAGRELPTLGDIKDANKGIADAIRDRIDAAREASKTIVEALRDELAQYQKVHGERLRGLEEAKSAAAKTRDEQIRAVRDATTATVDGIDRQIEALRDQERESDRASQDRERGRRRAIDGIKAEQDAVSRAHEDRLRALDEDSRAEQVAETAREQQLRAEVSAVRDAADERKRARNDEISALRGKLDEQKRQEQASKDAGAVATAQAELDKLNAQDMTRVRSESLDEYERRLDEHAAQVLTAQQRLADARKQQERNASQAEIEIRIATIQAAQTADDRATADHQSALEQRLRDEKRASDTRLAAITALRDAEDQAFTQTTRQHEDRTRQIEDEAGTDKQRTEDAKRATTDRITVLERERDAARAAADERIRTIQASKKTEQEAFDNAIADQRALMEKEKERIDDAIKQEQRKTDALTKELEKQLKSIQETASTGAAAWAASSATRTLTTVYQNVGSPYQSAPVTQPGGLAGPAFGPGAVAPGGVNPSGPGLGSLVQGGDGRWYAPPVAGAQLNATGNGRAQWMLPDGRIVDADQDGRITQDYGYRGTGLPPPGSAGVVFPVPGGGFTRPIDANTGEPIPIPGVAPSGPGVGGISPGSPAAIAQSYQRWLGRSASNDEVQAWIATGRTPEQIEIGIANSPEAIRRGTPGAGGVSFPGYDATGARVAAPDFEPRVDREFAAGGEMLLTEPTALVGLGSRTLLGVAGEAGVEGARFTPGGFGGRGQQADHVVLLSIDGREFARAVSSDSYERYRLSGGKG